MRKWETFKLGEVATIVMGQSPEGENYNHLDQGLPLLNGPTEFGFRFPNCTLYTTDTKRQCKRGDLIFCVRGSTTGKMNWADKIYSLGRGVCAIRGKDDEMTFIIRSWLDLNLEALLQYAVGSTFPCLNKDDIANFKIKIPFEYHRIASILGNYDALIANYEAQIQALQASAQQVYKEWFVRGRCPYGAYKKGENTHSEWRMGLIRDCIDFYIGGGWGEEEATVECTINGYVIRGTDIPNLRKGKVNRAVYRFHKVSNISTRTLQEGDIVFEVSGGSKDQSLGRNVLITKEILEMYGDKVIAASFCKSIRYNKDITSAYFLQMTFDNMIETGEIAQYEIQSTGISNYRFEDFLDFQPLVLPSKFCLGKFDAIIAPMYSQIGVLAKQINILKSTRDALLPRLLREG